MEGFVVSMIQQKPDAKGELVKYGKKDNQDSHS